MMKNSEISWTDHSFNPWIGCTKVSPACDNCYAETLMDKRMHVVQWGAGQPRKRTSEKNWMEPFRWDAESKANGVRYRVFCASIADVFDNEVPNAWRADLFRLIAKTPNLDWLLLTKRIGNAAEMLRVSANAAYGDTSRPPQWQAEMWPNVWIGATICNQEEADRDVPKLLALPAAKRFLSIEPLLGAIDLRSIKIPIRPVRRLDYATEMPLDALVGHMGGSPTNTIDWVIVGGESGNKARPTHPDWVRSLRDQCVQTRTPFHFKQWGEWFTKLSPCCPAFFRYDNKQDWLNTTNFIRGQIFLDATGRQLKRSAHFDDCIYPVTEMHKVGKRAAGRELDGRTWDEIPE
jgi:protein gp37